MNAVGRWSIWSVGALFASCAATPPMPPSPSSHPASPQALEAPQPDRGLLMDAALPTLQHRQENPQ